MSLFATLTQRLSDALLAQLAGAAALPLLVAKEYCGLAIPTLVRQLAKPADEEEINARWDMCRQLYVGQVLADTNELLRADMGWPDRRRYLAQKIVGAAQVAALAQATAWPAQTETLLGYLTIITLATLGEQADQHQLDPAALGQWLSQQQVPANSRDLLVAPGRPAARSSKRIMVLSAVGVFLATGVGGSYLLLGTPANAIQQEGPLALVAARPGLVAPTVEKPTSPPPDTTLLTELEQPAPPPVATESAARVAPLVAPAKGRPARAVAAGPVLRDTMGNAALARQVGGKFSVAQGRYLRGEGQPLIVKLANRATLTVGINSTESLLYKRLVNPGLPRPNDIALDRLAFSAGQARLGAEGAQQLGNVASLLRTFPKARLLVVGHANNSEAQAIRLGLQRATAAVAELVKQGISADRLQAQGVLATNLPTGNDSAEKQAMLQGISLKMSRL